MTGYLHPHYAESHRDHGTPLRLPNAGAWIITRPTPGHPYHDAMGCYPLFCCRDWSALEHDLAALDGLVSLAVVTDPFGDYDDSLLRRCFPDRAMPFKEHYVIDTARLAISRHHRRYVRKASDVAIEAHDQPLWLLDEWVALHANLKARYAIRGIAGFSPGAFALQFQVPGMVYFRATHHGEPVAGMMAFQQGDAVQLHVWAIGPKGYELHAPYALIAGAIEHFRGQARWLNLMGLPGREDQGHEGIRRFKEGWTPETRTAWLCGRILNPSHYKAITEDTKTTAATYFPAYREGEMA